jgi:prepilin-type N-terminal cleavage/methylation domain-containing protein
MMGLNNSSQRQSSNLNKKMIRLKKGFSLTEMLIALAITAIIITILFNTLLLGFQVHAKSIARTATREELTALTDFVIRDIRNADLVTDCGQIVESSCSVIADGTTIEWGLCDSTFVCRYTDDGSGPLLTYKTSENYLVDNFVFDPGLAGIGSSTQSNYIVTVVISHANENLNITNQIRQVSVSTRNYVF